MISMATLFFDVAGQAKVKQTTLMGEYANAWLGIAESHSQSPLSRPLRNRLIPLPHLHLLRWVIRDRVTRMSRRAGAIPSTCSIAGKNRYDLGVVAVKVEQGKRLWYLGQRECVTAV
jgi:hypothetical protein